jgi:hypothetical protein
MKLSREDYFTMREKNSLCHSTTGGRDQNYPFCPHPACL